MFIKIQTNNRNRANRSKMTDKVIKYRTTKIIQVWTGRSESVQLSNIAKTKASLYFFFLVKEYR